MRAFAFAFAVALALALLSLLLAESAPASHGGIVRGTVIVVDDSGKPIDHPRDVWVYLEDRDAHQRGTAPGAGVTGAINQHNQQFEPHVLVVPSGAVVSFPNLDNLEHSVFSPSDPPFNLGRYGTDKDGKSKRFDDAGEIEIYCDIHKQMSARVKVVDTTHFAEVVDGAYTLDDVPPGTYKVVAWMPDGREVKSGVITVVASGDVRVGEIHLHPGAPHLHKRRNGEEYPPY